MDSFYLTIALLTAGGSLLAAAINIYAGLFKDGEKVDLIFGILCLCVFIFLVTPPTGFILKDEAPYPLSIEIKRIFIWSYYGLLPWFITLYTGYKRRGIIYAIEFFLALSYVVMLLTETDRTIWFYISRIALALILYYGIAASIKQIRTNQRREGLWLLVAMSFFGILLLLSSINQAGNNFIARALNTNSFFPLHLNTLAFIAIMSIRLRVKTHEKYRLEKILRWRDVRWNLLVQNMHLMIVELDKEGNIRYLNPYALKKLGYTREEELTGLNWFNTFAIKEEASFLKTLYHEAITAEKPLSQFTSHIRLRDGNKVVNWTNVFVFNTDDSLNGVMSIGVDNTEQLKAYEQVRALKNELEKENMLLKGEKIEPSNEPDIIGQSNVLLYAIQKTKQAAVTNTSVLLLGETGSGKELFADLVHRNSYRSNQHFVKVNCATLPADLIESELFGHEKGSFTGAYMTRKGKFELADGGTIFLDEIGELPLSLQPKLLRVLQSGEFERIGGQSLIKVNVRLISATNRNLQQEVKEGRFREDLYYRLNVFPITIPALRERKGDIPLLVSYFINKFSAEHQKTISEVSRADLMRLSEYDWPGNIRELVNLIQRSMILSHGPVLHLDWQNGSNGNGSFTMVNENVTMEDVERAHILKILTECRWKINGDDGAASRLGLHPSTLRSRLKKLQIEREFDVSAAFSRRYKILGSSITPKKSGIGFNNPCDQHRRFLALSPSFTPFFAFTMS